MNELDQEIRQKLPECADAHVRKTGFAGKQPTEMRKPVSDFFICHESGFPSDEKIVTEGKWEVNSKRSISKRNRKTGGLAKWQQGYYAVENILLDYRWLSDKVMIN